MGAAGEAGEMGMGTGVEENGLEVEGMVIAAEFDFELKM